MKTLSRRFAALNRRISGSTAVARNLLLVAVIGTAVAGCGGSPAPNTPAAKAAPASSAGKPKAKRSSYASVEASSIASAPEGTLGPYVAYGARGAMALYSPGGESPRRWISQPISADGTPASEPKNAGIAPDDVSFAVLRSNEAAGRFIGLWTGEGTAGNGLIATVLRLDGSPMADPVVVTEGVRPVLWADAIPTRDGFVALWAEQEKGRARIVARRLTAGGVFEGDASVIEEAALAWQAEAVPGGAAVVVTRAEKQSPTLGKVVLRIVDAKGRPAGEATELTAGPTAQLDVDLARIGSSLLVAWTDRRDADSRVWVGVTDLQGKTRGQARGAIEPLGDQALIDLVQPSDPAVGRALLVVDSLPHARSDSFDATLAMLDEQGEVQGTTTRLALAVDSSSDTHFVGAPRGFLMLTRSRDCQPGEGSSAAAAAPWFLHIGRNQEVLAAAPLRWGDAQSDRPATAWAPGCMGDRCLAIGADAKNPATVVAMRLGEGNAACASPLTRTDQSAGARLSSNRALLSVDAPVSRLSVAQGSSSTLVAWITHFVEGPGGPARKPPPGAPGDPSKPMAAEIGVQPLNERGDAAGPRQLISVRAESSGGIALAPGGAPGSDACLAWVARDNGDPQVFLTRLGPNGARKTQRMLTRAKGDASDVAIERVAGGWVVAWVDFRDGNGEVYAVKVDDQLRSSGPEVRLTNAPGDASEVSLLSTGEEVLVVYGDSRDQGGSGIANPYYRRVRASNGSPVGEEQRIARTPLHTRSARFLRVGSDVIAAWLEVAVPGLAEDSRQRPGLRFVRFDPVAGQAIVAPTLITPEPEAATSFAAQCDDSLCRGVMSVDAGASAQLRAFMWAPKGRAPTVEKIATIGGPPAADISPALLGSWLYFSDVGVSGDHRIRRAQLAWGNH